jgi:hypothetical protein
LAGESKDAGLPTTNAILNLIVANGLLYWVEQVNDDVHPSATVWAWCFP